MVAAAATPAWLPYRQGPGLLGLNIEGAATITTFNTLSRGIAILIVYFKDAGCIMAAAGTGFTLRSSYTSTAGSTLTLARQSDGTWLEISRSTPMEGSTAWTAWTPACAQGASNPAVHVQFSQYAILGKIAFLHFGIDFTSVGAGAADVIISGWPTAINPAQAGGRRVKGGMAHYLRSGIAEIPCMEVELAGQQDMRFWITAVGRLGANAVAVGDTLDVSTWWAFN